MLYADEGENISPTSILRHLHWLGTSSHLDKSQSLQIISGHAPAYLMQLLEPTSRQAADLQKMDALCATEPRFKN
jgi:uncharacterized protein (DUF2249 family)